MTAWRTSGTAVARSPLEGSRAGAVPVVRDLHAVPARGLWLADLHGVGIGNLRGGDASERLAAELGRAPETIGELVDLGGVWAGRLTSDELLLLARDEMQLESSLRSMRGDGPGSLFTATVTTHGYGVLALGGPHSRGCLGKLTGLDLREHAFTDSRLAQTSVANVRATLLRKDLDHRQAYIILVGRSVGAYVLEVMIECTADLERVIVEGASMRERWFAD